MTTAHARQTIAVLLIAAAALFVIGVRAEGDDDHTDEPTTEATENSESEEGASDEVESHEETEAREQQETTEEGEEGEKVLGIDLESPMLVGAAVVVSILLAGLTLARRDRQLLLTVTLFAGPFAVLDAAEVVHQLDGDNTGLAVLAAVIAVLPTSAALLALQQESASRPTSPEHQSLPT